MSEPTRSTRQAKPKPGVSPHGEAIAAWLIAALILAGGGTVARLLIDYPQFRPNSYVGFLIYRAGPTLVFLCACAAAAIPGSPLAQRRVLFAPSIGSTVEFLTIRPPFTTKNPAKLP